MCSRVKHYILLILLALASCGTQEKKEEQPYRGSDLSTPRDTTVVVNVDTIEVPVEKETYIEEVPQSSTNHTAEVETYNAGNESKDDYWEVQRKHSPNDNYLLGFDEDVDDVHDMELYMEDY